MRYCLGIKGVFSINDVRNGLDTTDKYNECLMKSIVNMKESLIEPLLKDGHTVDVICSVYDTAFVPIIEREFQPKRVFKFPKSIMNEGGDWNRQLIHYIKLSEEILQYEQEINQPYDYYIFTRFDLLFIGTLNDWKKNWSIDMEKFNITMKHSSGNCDETIFIFPRQYFIPFVNAVINVYNRQGITHTINHRLVDNNVPINYMYVITEDDYKNNTCYKHCTFNRTG